MAAENMDRRVRKTRTMLRLCLAKLLKEKKIQEISVKEISEMADINRGTFYLHYRDVYDLLSSIEADMFCQFNAILERNAPGGTYESPNRLLLELFSFIRCPQAYDISQTVSQAYMVRAVNVQRLLEIIRKPENSRFIIRVEGDPFIEENNGTWEVCGKSAVRTDLAPDLTVSVQAFGQMAAGCASLSEAVYRPDVTVTGNPDVLEKVFVRKPVLVQDHF